MAAEIPAKRQRGAACLDYLAGFSVAELMATNVTGIVTMGDGFILSESMEELRGNIEHLLSSGCDAPSLKTRFDLGKNYADWVISNRQALAIDDARFTRMTYRPFDARVTYFDNRLIWRWREKVMRHLFNKSNICVLLTRQTKDEVGAFVGDSIAAHKAFSAYDITYVNPLYLYPDEQDLDQSIRVNFDPKLYFKIRAAAGLTGKAAAPDSAMVESGAFRTVTGDARPDEVKVFDYIYGVLHGPAYRETYAEFLKIDFPRVPFPPSPEVFRTISEQGEALRRLHLMEEAAIGDTPYAFHGEGAEGEDCVVDKPRFEPQPDGTGRVYINGKGDKGQYFEGVPAVSWGFPIGGYQPAQKWLKDRKGRALSWDDIRHYQKVIKILAETDRIMRGVELSLD